MKNWKISLLTIFSFLALSSVVLFASCEQDPCVDLDCKNGGTCSDGYCQCPTGFEGAECNITAASRFVGIYAGSVQCEGSAIQTDTLSIELIQAPDQIRLKIGVGNTSVLGFDGVAATPEASFETYEDNKVIIHAYATVNGNLIHVYLETLDKQTTNRQVCKFTGTRISAD